MRACKENNIEKLAIFNAPQKYKKRLFVIFKANECIQIEQCFYSVFS